VRRCIAALQSQYGAIAPIGRIVNDADRLLKRHRPGLGIDADELDFGRAAPQLHAGEKIPVPDTQSTPASGAAWTTKASAGSSAQMRAVLAPVARILRPAVSNAMPGLQR